MNFGGGQSIFISLTRSGIPAFILAVIQLVWICCTHDKWSRRFGLDTTYTVVLSTAVQIRAVHHIS